MLGWTAKRHKKPARTTKVFSVSIMVQVARANVGQNPALGVLRTAYFLTCKGRLDKVDKINSDLLPNHCGQCANRRTCDFDVSESASELRGCGSGSGVTGPQDLPPPCCLRRSHPSKWGSRQAFRRPVWAKLAAGQGRCEKTTLPLSSLMESPRSARRRSVYTSEFWDGLNLQLGRGHDSF